jgi:chemosensory pili system protein ChpA (sensor histidine kinase/response regulator)
MPSLQKELLSAAQELGGLGEMLELQAFSNLCGSVTQHLETAPEQIEAIARTALAEWRRSQAMVFVGQTEALPAQLDLSNLDSAAAPSPAGTQVEEESFDEAAFPEASLDSYQESDNFDEEVQELLSSLEEATPEQQAVEEQVSSAYPAPSAPLLPLPPLLIPVSPNLNQSQQLLHLPAKLPRTRFEFLFGSSTSSATCMGN